MSHNVVGIGPSLVDIGVSLSDEHYTECCTVLGVQPGDWTRIADADKFAALTSVLTAEETPSGHFLNVLQDQHEATINAGSSTLGMISAMSPEMRTHAAMVSALAENAGTPDPLSIFFRAAVQSVGSRHYGRVYTGHNPVGFVISSESTPEKVLANYPGVANELEDYDVKALQPELLILDAYELQVSKLGTFLDQLVQSGEFRIGLSLGNHSILTGELRDRIRQYIAGHKINVLCGNDTEYRALYPELEKGLATAAGFRSHPVLSDVPFAVMTFGEQGMVAQWDGNKIVSTPADTVEVYHIKNTSGAGDTTAGVIYEGILSGSEADETLRKAARMAAKVLQTYSSRIVAES